MRVWYCHTGKRIELAPDVPLTMYNGVNHRIVEWDGDALGQMLTGCGERACPVTLGGVHAGYRLREVPGRGPVDCPECIRDDPAWHAEPVSVFSGYGRPLRIDTGMIAFTAPKMCPICDGPISAIARGEIWVNRDEGRVLALAEPCMHLVELAR